jgi:hypothetical protein
MDLLPFPDESRKRDHERCITFIIAFGCLDFFPGMASTENGSLHMSKECLSGRGQEEKIRESRRLKELLLL